LAPWADLLYACDGRWWDHHRPSFQGEKWTQAKIAAHKYQLFHIPGAHRNGLSLTPGLIHFGEYNRNGGNSGFQLLNLLILMGARNIALIGYDMMQVNGKTHWFGNRGKGLPSPGDRTLKYWIQGFSATTSQLKEIGAKVVNCTRQSALECFPKIPLEAYLEEITSSQRSSGNNQI
jgi:hypothetical protein